MVCDLWFVIGESRSVLFVSCFKVRCFVIVLFRAIIDYRLVNFASQIFIVFLVLVTCKNKAMSASFLRQKIYSPLQFPSLFLSSLESFSAKLGEHVTLWFALTPPSLKWLTEQKTQNTVPSLKFAKRAARYNEFRCNSNCKRGTSTSACCRNLLPSVYLADTHTKDTKSFFYFVWITPTSNLASMN